MSSKKIDKPQNQLIKLIEQASRRHSLWEVFTDFIQMSAIAVSNRVDLANRAKREEVYLQTIQKYGKKEQSLFPQMLVCLVEIFENNIAASGPRDVLGIIHHELGLCNKRTGQFFTPVSICELIALMTCGDATQDIIRTKGFISLNEPASGSGAMVLAFAKAMRQAGMSYCNQLVVTAHDIDISCVHMTYLQLALYGIPAVVIHGNTLRAQEWSRWYSPMYVLDGWLWRQKCGITDKPENVDEYIKRTQEPVYSAIRGVETIVAKDEIFNILHQQGQL